MLGHILENPVVGAMQRGMEAASLRQEVISHNIANVNTPYFKKSDVVFEELLAKELDAANSNEMPLIRTHDRHMPVGVGKPVVATIERQDTSTMRVDGNNVDIDIEMASLSKNNLYYNALARQIGGYFQGLRSVMTSQ
ncbi:flagellar basal body rod protein FlgB [Selenomonas sp. TAMA-11512]|uniref:flagellar basal body rod protein FlgB n=1 Tax=Selenomonas sp. TAMA-11512 TaxID=3095337 RepID=UPI003093CFC3|nr:flagellar basal body rod protein FlgB [Selenomonas sp. TAMA-11512]